MRRIFSRYKFQIWLLVAIICVPGIVIAADFINASANTVIDKRTGLVWQTCSAPTSGPTCNGGTKQSYNWSQALAACEGSTVDGNSDWRLPNRNQEIKG